MAIQKINLGTEPHGVGGDSYRTANDKINKNFEEVSTNITSVDEKYSNTEVKITEEVARAKQVEDELKTNLEKEVSRAVSAEADILGVVESESKARTAENIQINEAQTQLKNLVDSEVEKLKLEDTSIKTDLDKTHRYAVMSQTLGLGSKFYDKDGQPLSGGKIYTYEAGTSTPSDTYKDVELSTSNTNPIILDETGSADVFLKDTYRFRIFDKNDIFIEEQELVKQPATLGNLDTFSKNIDTYKKSVSLEIESLKERTTPLESIADLSTIKNPKDGLRVYVKSYRTGLGIGGGYFVYDSTKANVNNSGTVINGWVRDFKNTVSIVDFGGHSAATAIENATALNKALAACKIVVIPVGDFNLEPNIVKINNKNRLYCYGQLIGTEKDMSAKADLAGVYINASGVDDFDINTVNIRNGYRGIGINVEGCKNFTIDKPVVDGFTFGIRIAEQDYKVENSQGCQNFTVNKPVIKNTRYWGLYIRSLNITDEAKKTKNFKVVKPSFYNCHMAGFVAAEGNVKNFVLDNPYFDRCNVSMHFESASNYTIINPRDNDTGKKSDHVQANTEYPFVNWSLYQCFVRDSKVIGGVLVADVEHMATKGGECKNLHYTNLTARTFIFEGAGEEQDTNKDFFDDVSFSQCTTTNEFIYQQPTDKPKSYIRNLRITDSECLLKGDGNGAAVAVSIPRGVNIKVNDNTFHNACLRITASGILSVKNNNWLIGTDNTQSIFDGIDGGLGAGNFGEIIGNTFTRAGGVVIGSSAILVKNFTKIRVDNTIRGNSVNYAYEMRDNYRIELGAGITYDTMQGEYVESGTTTLIKLYSV